MVEPVAITNEPADNFSPVLSFKVCRSSKSAIARRNLNLPLPSCCSRYSAKLRTRVSLRAMTWPKLNVTSSVRMPHGSGWLARCMTSAAYSRALVGIHPRRKPKAATEDVLGSAAKPVRINPKWQKQYDRLVELRDHLTSRRANLTNDALSEQPTFSSHMADAATDTFDRDFALGMLSSEQ